MQYGRKITEACCLRVLLKVKPCDFTTLQANMPDPIHIRSGSDGKHWPEAGRMILAHQLASGPDPFGQMLPVRIRLAKTRHNQPELNRIRAGFAQYYLGHPWTNGTEPESGKLVADHRSRSARNRAGNSCTPACFQTRSVWSNPDQAIQTGYGSVLHSMIPTFFG